MTVSTYPKVTCRRPRLALPACLSQSGKGKTLGCPLFVLGHAASVIKERKGEIIKQTDLFANTRVQSTHWDNG